MNEKNTKTLLKDFPRLYRNPNWEISCGDGWFDLIYKLSSDIETAARNAGLDKYADSWPMAIQVKEKFGILRYYLKTPYLKESLEHGMAPNPGGLLEFRPVASIESIRQLIAEAERKSVEICEACGLPGDLKQDNCWHVSCSLCEKIRVIMRVNKRALREQKNR